MQTMTRNRPNRPWSCRLSAGARRPGGRLALVPMRPTEPTNKAHWNNEVEGLRLWVPPPKGRRADQRAWELPNPPAAVSLEGRVEFEIRAPKIGFTGGCDDSGVRAGFRL